MSALVQSEVVFSARKLHEFMPAYFKQKDINGYEIREGDDKIHIVSEEKSETHSPAKFLNEKDLYVDFFEWYLESIVSVDANDIDNKIEIPKQKPTVNNGDLKLIFHSIHKKYIDGNMIKNIKENAE